MKQSPSPHTLMYDIWRIVLKPHHFFTMGGIQPTRKEVHLFYHGCITIIGKDGTEGQYHAKRHLLTLESRLKAYKFSLSCTG